MLNTDPERTIEKSLLTYNEEPLALRLRKELSEAGCKRAICETPGQQFDRLAGISEAAFTRRRAGWPAPQSD